MSITSWSCCCCCSLAAPHRFFCRRSSLLLFSRDPYFFSIFPDHFLSDVSISDFSAYVTWIWPGYFQDWRTQPIPPFSFPPPRTFLPTLLLPLFNFLNVRGKKIPPMQPGIPPVRSSANSIPGRGMSRHLNHARHGEHGTLKTAEERDMRPTWPFPEGKVPAITINMDIIIADEVNRIYPRGDCLRNGECTPARANKAAAVSTFPVLEAPHGPLEEPGPLQQSENYSSVLSVISG